jgi:hypothetical protein
MPDFEAVMIYQFKGATENLFHFLEERNQG